MSGVMMLGVGRLVVVVVMKSAWQAARNVL